MTAERQVWRRENESTVKPAAVAGVLGNVIAYLCSVPGRSASEDVDVAFEGLHDVLQRLSFGSEHLADEVELK